MHAPIPTNSYLIPASSDKFSARRANGLLKTTCKSAGLIGPIFSHTRSGRRMRFYISALRGFTMIRRLQKFLFPSLGFLLT